MNTRAKSLCLHPLLNRKLAAVTIEVIAHLAFCAGWPSAMWAARASLYDADRKSENRSDGEAMSKDNVVVGFVGLGTMGGRMATNVQRAGLKLVVHDLHRQAASHHLAAGAIWVDSPRALAREADVIFSSLPMAVRCLHAWCRRRETHSETPYPSAKPTIRAIVISSIGARQLPRGPTVAERV